MFRKFASAVILEAQMGADAGFAKSAHRAVFNYIPRAGYLYVRSRAISSRCNDNFDAFPAEEIEKSFLTFIGKPVFVNHHNEDHRRARGVIIDAALHKDRNPDGTPDTWAEVLMEVDAVRFPKLAKAILAGEVDRTSMGCDVQISKCSACGNVASSPLEYCAHIPGKKGKKIYKVDPATGQRTAQLIFEICSGLSFFENSLLVEAPADPTAFFLGNVEVGPGLEHLTAGMSKTASRENHVLLREAFQGDHFNLIGEDEARGDSRPVSEEEFRDLARKGRHQYEELAQHSGGTGGLDKNWSAIKNHGFNEAQKPWGGATYNAETGHPLETDADRYAITVRPHGANQISIPENSNHEEFSHAMDQARHHYGDVLSRKDHHLGVFHDNDKGTIDIDPVVVLNHHHQVETVGAYTHAVGGAYHFKSGNGFWPPHVKGHMRQVASLTERTPMIWGLINEASRVDDDLFDWDFIKEAVTNEDTDEWYKQNRPDPKNIVHLFHYAADNNYFKGSGLPKTPEHAMHSGLSWYSDMHHVGNALAQASHKSVGLDEHGKHSPELARNRTFGALAVYSEGTDVPMNYHQASLASRTGKAIWAKKTNMSPDEQSKEFGTIKTPKGETVPGKPKSMDTQWEKVNGLFQPTTKHFNEHVKAPKTNNYGHLGYQGGDLPGTHDREDLFAKGGDKRRVVVDRHALSASVGRRIDGNDFNHAGLSKYPKSTKDPLAHINGAFGSDANKHYSLVADAYRVAADHLSHHYGQNFDPHQVQAVVWGVQRHLNDNGALSNPKNGRRPSSWKKGDEDTWNSLVTHKHSWLNDHSDAPAFEVPTQFKNRPNTRNINNWEGHVDRNPEIATPIRSHFNEEHGGHGHWGKKMAYGETKSPQDVDTLRSENCTVCGNSSAWDGTQCQVCGYVAPPRPFGDPNTDIAGQQDIRKQVLDGTEADPNDPNQQLGQQLGNPEELEDQQDATAAGENTQLQTLTCQNCGTGLQPTAPESESGEPPYPAEGDVCPVCKKGQLLGDADANEDEVAAEAEGTPIDEDAEDQNGPGQSDKDGDSGANEDSKGTSNSDDDDQDDGDAFDPKQKGSKKTSSWYPNWFTPVWFKQ